MALILRFAISLTCSGISVLALFACAEPVIPGAAVPVRVDRVVMSEQDIPIVVLEEEGGPRWLPISIGSAEARSIALQIAQHPAERPNSHDLTTNLIHELEGHVARVVITERRRGTFYALLDIAVGQTHVMLDARPSDAIAIALRDRAPVFVNAEVFTQRGEPEATKDAEKAPTERRI